MSTPFIYELLQEMNTRQASDLYLTVGAPPRLRIDSRVLDIGDRPLEIAQVLDILNTILTGRQRREYETSMELNASLDLGPEGRFRVNVLRQRQNPALVIRRIISQIPTVRELKLPAILEQLVMEKRGLVLLTGMTGSGKSTTMAAMIDYRNNNEEGHIVTIEDPIEYYHEHKKCVISQREVGVDTESFAIAMRNVLRQRPDVIMVGEIREQEVMEQALTSAETGHLCLSTIHTNNAYQAIERIVNMFPEEQSHQIRLNLSANLKAIIAQRLLPSIDGKLVPAIEILINQGLIRDLILKGDILKIRDVMEQTAAAGMMTFDQSIVKLFADGIITEETALANSDRSSDMKIKIQQVRLSSKSGGAKGEKSGGILQKMDTSRFTLRE